MKNGSIYTIKLLRRGVDISGVLEQNILKGLKVKQIMKEDVATVPEGMALINLINTFKVKDIAYLHVVYDNLDLTGIISFLEIRPLFVFLE